MDGRGDLVDPMDILHDRCQEIEAGGTLVLSSKSYPNGKYLYEYAESSGQKGGEPLENRREALDVAALRSLGVPERALTQDAATGSYALADVHRSILFNTCEGILTQLVASYQRYVIDKTILLNWPSAADKSCSKRRSSKSAPTLTLRTQPFGDDRRDSLAKLAETILQAPKLPPLISAGIIDLSSLLATARLPLGKDADQKIQALDQPEAPPQPPTPPAPKSAPTINPAPTTSSSQKPKKKTIVTTPTLSAPNNLPDSDFRQAPKGKPVKVGPRGGRYYYTDTGKKVYVDRDGNEIDDPSSENDSSDHEVARPGNDDSRSQYPPWLRDLLPKDKPYTYDVHRFDPHAEP